MLTTKPALKEAPVGSKGPAGTWPPEGASVGEGHLFLGYCDNQGLTWVTDVISICGDSLCGGFIVNTNQCIFNPDPRELMLTHKIKYIRNCINSVDQVIRIHSK